MPSIIRERPTPERDIEYQIHFEITSKGRPAEGPSYSSGGQPAEPPEYDITSIEEGVYLPDMTTPTWIDIKTMGNTPEQLAEIDSWAEDQIDLDEITSALQDEADTEADYHYDAYRDRMSGYED